jgi:SLT domain-containing protein
MVGLVSDSVQSENIVMMSQGETEQRVPMSFLQAAQQNEAYNSDASLFNTGYISTNEANQRGLSIKLGNKPVQ